MSECMSSRPIWIALVGNVIVAATTLGLLGWNGASAHAAARNTARFSMLWLALGFAAPGLVRFVKALPEEARLIQAFLAAHVVHFAVVVLLHLTFEPRPPAQHRIAALLRRAQRCSLHCFSDLPRGVHDKPSLAVAAAGDSARAGAPVAGCPQLACFSGTSLAERSDSACDAKPRRTSFLARGRRAGTAWNARCGETRGRTCRKSRSTNRIVPHARRRATFRSRSTAFLRSGRRRCLAGPVPLGLQQLRKKSNP